VERIKKERTKAALYLVTDGVEVEVKLQKNVAQRPYLEDPAHPLNHWLLRSREALVKGEVREALDYVQRMETEINLDEQRLRAAYEKFDHDGSGSMEPSEFRHFAVYVGLGAEAVDIILKSHGPDGSISLAEFSDFVGRMGGTHALFEERRKKLEATGDHFVIEPGSRVRTHFYSKGRKSRWVWDARILEFAPDGRTVVVMLDMGKFHLRQTVPRDWVHDEDLDVVEALQEIAIFDDAQHYWTIILPPSEQQVVKTLTSCQRAAICHVRTMAADSHSRALPQLMDRARAIGLSQEQLWHTLTWIRDSAPIIIHLRLDKVGKFLERDTHYRNQFETNSSSGLLDLATREEWEADLFGESYNGASAHERPKYGVLDVMNDYRGVACCDQYGDSYLVLKNARLRCTFAPEDSGGICGSRLAVLDQYAHVLLEYGDIELREVARVASAPEGSEDRIGDSYQLEQYNYKEAQIHGPIDLSKHVLRLVVNERHKAPDAEYGMYQIQALCRRHGWELVWMDEERNRRISEERRCQAPRPFHVNWGSGELESQLGMEEPDTSPTAGTAEAAPASAPATLQLPLPEAALASATGTQWLPLPEEGPPPGRSGDSHAGAAEAEVLEATAPAIENTIANVTHSFVHSGTKEGWLEHATLSTVANRAGNRGVGALGPEDRESLLAELKGAS